MAMPKRSALKTSLGLAQVSAASAPKRCRTSRSIMVVVVMVMMVMIDPVVMVMVVVPPAMMVVMIPPAIVVVMVMVADVDVLRELDVLPDLLLCLARHGRVGGPQHRYGIRDRVEELGIGLGRGQHVRCRPCCGLRGAIE